MNGADRAGKAEGEHEIHRGRLEDGGDSWS